MTTNHQLEPVRSTTSARTSLDLSVQRQRAGIVSLSLFGNSNQLDYFTDDEEQDVSISNGPMSAVAMRPTSNILTAYRQVNIPRLCFSYMFCDISIDKSNGGGFKAQILKFSVTYHVII